MKRRYDFKAQLISEQKPRKRRPRTDQTRNRDRIDLIRLHRDIVATGRRRRSARRSRVRGAFLAFMAILVFFALGYLVAALSVSMWVKVILFVIIAVVGFSLSYLVAAIFR